MNYSIFDKLSIQTFNLNEFKKKYLYQEGDDLDLSPLEQINGILLDELFIKEEYKGMGHGTKFVQKLKSEGKPIIVYSLFGVEDFWEKLGFENIIDDYIYVWGLNL